MVRAAVLALLGAALAVRPAAATPYETFIDIDDQADLDDLLAAGDITQDTFNELLDLLEGGVDLSMADRAELYALPNLTYDDVDRILAYREKQNGIIRDPADLVAAGALSQDKLLAISAFIVVRGAGDKLGVKGWVRGMTRFTPRDPFAPPFALRGRFSAYKHAKAGFAGVFTRLEIGAPVYDPNRAALIADPRGYKVELPKVFVQWEDDHTSAILGSFRAGFGQRLVFDNSQHYTPNGLYLDDELFYSSDLQAECRETTGELAASPCAGARGGRYVTPDWGWRDGLFGAAIGTKRLDLGSGWLQAYAWASSTRRKIYQYELVDRAKCEDPHDDTKVECAAPSVFVRPDGPLLTPSSRFTFVTLPDVFAEKLVGANVAYFADRRSSIGMVAYGASETSLVSGIDLDTQEWSRIPTGGRYGAAGGNFSFGRSWLDVFGEAAFSFDRMPNGPGPQDGGGGPAGILRVTATKKRQELEATLRYLGIDYANPYARPIAQSDEFDGQRARDEAGGRLRYYMTSKQVALRALVDLWVPLTSLEKGAPLGRAQPKLDSYLRADVRTTDQLRVGLWVRYQDKDLRAGGHMQCFEVSTETSETGEPIPCSGRQVTTIGRVELRPERTIDVTAMLEHQLVDDGTATKTPFGSKFRQDVAGWLIAMWRPDPKVRLRGRLRYLHEAINDGADDYLERSLSGLLDGTFVLRGRDLVRARIDVKSWLDGRTSTLARSPNPEVQLWLSYEARL